MSSTAPVSPSGSRAWIRSAGRGRGRSRSAPRRRGADRPARGLAVVVDPGLADRPHLLVLGEEGDRFGLRVVEAGGLGRVTAGGRKNALVALGSSDRLRVGLLLEADVEHPLDPRLQGSRDDLGLGPLAEEEMGVGVDHDKAQPILAEGRSP